MSPVEPRRLGTAPAPALASRQIGLAKWVDIVQRTAAAIYQDDCFGWAAQLAYFWFLALFPALLFLVALASYLPVQSQIDAAVRALSQVAPSDVLVIVREQLDQITQGDHVGLLTFSLLGTLWTSSSGMAAIISTVNQAYHVREGRPWWRVRLMALGLTIALTSLVLVSLATALAGPALARRFAINPSSGQADAWAWTAVQWLLIVALVVTALEWVYYFAPNVRHTWVRVTPGSVVATILGLLLSLGFRWYASHFGSYQKTYGAIGGVIVALLWLYGSGLAILVGAELNATIELAEKGPLPEAEKPADPASIPGATPNRPTGHAHGDSARRA